MVQTMKPRVGILISGRGTNMAALIAAAQAAGYPAEVALVLSNTPDAAGLAVARQAGVAAEVIDHRPFGKDRPSHETAIDSRLRSVDVDIVCLAGYMRILTPLLINRWSGRMLNIHPSLLPAFPGLHTHARALEAGVRLHGCTVHHVIEAVDAGPIIAQAAVPVLPGDTEESLASRVLAAENALYPAAVAAAIGGAEHSAADPAARLANVWSSGVSIAGAIPGTIADTGPLPGGRAVP